MIATVSMAVAGITVGIAKKAEPGVLDRVNGYQTWTKVNPKPVRLLVSTDILCIGAAPGLAEEFRKINPHFDRYVTVYVNKIGENAMMKGGTFPKDSVVVKEKHEGENGPVILSTVMIKREKGYNPACGDWEFAAIDAFASKTNGEGKLESCMRCHREQKSNDFLFKTYIGAKSYQTASGWDDGFTPGSTFEKLDKKSQKNIKVP